ncbi:MAG: 50S ribosomal protein L11 methyltransferase [Deltaproteobacteria bacterium]|nr:50S ribosomal protein L11 methyltransferase [Deltaproteobacteria bacterium]MBW1941949.1 50S ribosomal protein L11 methyltransferase [Deltaproteobacteria bacterium]
MSRDKDQYNDLYIYLLQGAVDSKEEGFLGDAFLGNWVEDSSSFLFFSEPSPEIVSRLLESRPALKLIDDYHFTYEQWQGGGLEPFKVEHIHVVPPWRSVDAAEHEIRIILDPGVVFGTGLHPTTRDCLRAMVYLRRNYVWKRVADFGTGTGILAIAAMLLGGEEVLAVDLNPLCVKTAQGNVSLNGLGQSVRVLEGDVLDFAEEAADLAIANIHYDVLHRLLGMEEFLKKEWYLFSGLMRSQVRDMKGLMTGKGLELVKEWDHEMTWYTLLVKGHGVME